MIWILSKAHMSVAQMEVTEDYASTTTYLL